MTQYITIKKLEKCLKAMAILDVIMIASKDAWLRLTSYQESEHTHSYVLRNGSGDELTIIFTTNGALIKGFDHENELNQFGADEWDSTFFEYTYANLPKEFAELLNEDDIDNTTFCMWCMDETNAWTQNETKGNDGGKSFLLNYICQTAEEWCEWAKYYYEMDIVPEVVQKIYQEEQLTKEDVIKLNMGRDAKEVFSEIDKFALFT